MPISFSCPECGADFQVPDEMSGKQARCKACGGVLTVPPRAGQWQVEEDEADGGSADGPGRQDDAVSTLIPYKNSNALASYYLGIFGIAFGCIPVLGLIMPIAAIVMGRMGLKYRKEHPEAHGTAHAWVGIVCGSIVVGVWIVLAIIFAVSFIMAAMNKP